MIYSNASVASEIKLVLHPDGSMVPHPRTISAVLGGAVDQAYRSVFNSGLPLVRGFPHATIRLTCGGETPAWRNLGECVSFESHSRHVHDVADSCDVVSRAMKEFRCARFGQASAHNVTVRQIEPNGAFSHVVRWTSSSQRDC